MQNTETVVVHLKEGNASNYHEAFKKDFGGEIKGNVFEFKQGRTHVRSVAYPIIPGFEIMISNSIYTKNIEMIRQPDDNPDLFHFYLINEGSIEQNFNNEEKQFEAGTTAGVFINNGLFPMHAHFPAFQRLKSVGFKITTQAIERMMPEAIEIMQTLFKDEEPLGYHTSLPIELDSLLNDMFRFKKSEFGKIPLVVARGLELFTLLMRSVKELVDKDELNGLHVDDYERLLKIRDQLLSSFDQKIIVEDIALEHGISVSKLKRDFKTLFDTSVYQFYTQAKMDEAYHRLQTGKYSVMEVGYDMGYNNLSKFSQMFKKLKGINPKEVKPL